MVTTVRAETVNDRLDVLDEDAVRGPAGGVTTNHLAKWDDTEGRLLKDGGAGGGGGGGDVNGPGAAVGADNLATWNGTGGTDIQDSGVAIADVITAISDSAAVVSAIGVAGGLATLDVSTKVPIAQIPTGTTGSTVALGNHAHAGMGDVVGPGSATDGRVALMDGATGKLIKVGPRLEADLVDGPSSVTDGRVCAFDGTGGKRIKQDTRLVVDLMAGPASSTADNLASFNGTGGKTAKDSGIAAAAVVTLTGTQVLENKTHVQATSTSFPGSPVDGQRHWRSDHNEWYRWNNSLSKWLGETSHATPFGFARASGVNSLTLTYANPDMSDTAGAPLYFGDRKARLLFVAWGIRVGTGGAVWTLRLRLNTSGSDTFVGANTATGVASTWVKKNLEAVSVSLAANDNVVMLANRGAGTENMQVNGILIWCWEG